MNKIMLYMLFLAVVLCSFSAQAASTFYQYDNSGRLIRATAGQYMIGYEYDEVGNVTAISSFTTGSFIDSDNDGMDDNWELFYFGDLTTANETTDKDHDGYLDAEEYSLWTAGASDEAGYPYDPLLYNLGEKNPESGNILLMVVPILSGSVDLR